MATELGHTKRPTPPCACINIANRVALLPMRVVVAIMVPIMMVPPLPIFLLFVPVAPAKILMPPVRLIFPPHVIDLLIVIPAVILVVIRIVHTIPRMRCAPGDQRHSRKRSSHRQRTPQPATISPIQSFCAPLGGWTFPSFSIPELVLHSVSFSAASSPSAICQSPDVAAAHLAGSPPRTSRCIASTRPKAVCLYVVCFLCLKSHQVNPTSPLR